MEKVKIAKKPVGISKTFRLPQEQIDALEELHTKSGQSVNKIVIQLLDFALKYTEK